MPAGIFDLFTKIDRFDPSLPYEHPGQGYQRKPDPPRVRKFARYIMQGPESILPTAILLNARGPLIYNDAKGTLTLDSDTPLQLVDGQHRVHGFLHAIGEQSCAELKDFPVPAVIVKELDKISEMQQFRIVNGTAKSVRTGLVNVILTKLAAAKGDGVIGPEEACKVVCTRAVETINTQGGSPWKGRILMPNQTKFTRSEIQQDLRKAHLRVVRATSFITSLHPLCEYLEKHGFTRGTLAERGEFLANVVMEYWGAIRELMPQAFDAPADYVIQKTPGIFSLHAICHRLLARMHLARRAWVKKEFKIMLEGCDIFTSAAYWDASEGDASKYGSMKGFSELARLIDEDLQSSAPLTD